MSELEDLLLQEARDRQSGRVFRRFIGLLAAALFLLVLGMASDEAALGGAAALVLVAVAVWSLVGERRRG
jgi:uncharacterized MnhB-related membrane protein